MAVDSQKLRLVFILRFAGKEGKSAAPEEFFYKPPGRGGLPKSPPPQRNRTAYDCHPTNRVELLGASVESSAKEHEPYKQTR